MFNAQFQGPHLFSFSSLLTALILSTFQVMESSKNNTLCFLISKQKTKPHEKLQKEFSSYSKCTAC